MCMEAAFSQQMYSIQTFPHWYTEKTDAPFTFLVSLCFCLLTNHELLCPVYVTYVMFPHLIK